MRCIKTGKEEVHWQAFTNQTSRADSNLARSTSEESSHMLSRVVSVGEAIGTSTRIGSAGVRSDGPQLTSCQNLLRPKDRRSFDAVRCEHPCRIETRPDVHYQAYVGLARILQARGDSRRGESLCCSDTHGATPNTDSPVASPNPNMRFAF